MASPVIADPFHRMKYMERHGSGLRKIVRETEKPPGYTAAYNPKIFSTATDFRVILKNVNYQLSQKNLVNDQVSEQDKSPDIPHTVLNLCIHLIAHGSEGAQITHAHSIMGTVYSPAIRHIAHNIQPKSLSRTSSALHRHQKSSNAASISSIRSIQPKSDFFLVAGLFLSPTATSNRFSSVPNKPFT